MDMGYLIIFLPRKKQIDDRRIIINHLDGEEPPKKNHLFLLRFHWKVTENVRWCYKPQISKLGKFSF